MSIVFAGCSINRCCVPRTSYYTYGGGSTHNGLPTTAVPHGTNQASPSDPPLNSVPNFDEPVVPQPMKSDKPMGPALPGGKSQAGEAESIPEELAPELEAIPTPDDAAVPETLEETPPNDQSRSAIPDEAQSTNRVRTFSTINPLAQHAGYLRRNRSTTTRNARKPSRPATSSIQGFSNRGKSNITRNQSVPRGELIPVPDPLNNLPVYSPTRKNSPRVSRSAHPIYGRDFNYPYSSHVPQEQAGSGQMITIKPRSSNPARDRDESLELDEGLYQGIDNAIENQSHSLVPVAPSDRADDDLTDFEFEFDAATDAPATSTSPAVIIPEIWPYSPRR